MSVTDAWPRPWKPTQPPARPAARRHPPDAPQVARPRPAGPGRAHGPRDRAGTGRRVTGAHLYGLHPRRRHRQGPARQRDGAPVAGGRGGRPGGGQPRLGPDRRQRRLRQDGRGRPDQEPVAGVQRLDEPGRRAGGGRPQPLRLAVQAEGRGPSPHRLAHLAAAGPRRRAAGCRGAAARRHAPAPAPRALGAVPATNGRGPGDPRGHAACRRRLLGRRVGGDVLGVPHQGADLGRPARRAERLVALGEEGRVGGGEVLPLGRDVVLVEDRLHRADGLAGAAVHALVGVDVEHAVALVDAVDRALLDAGLVLHVDAGLGDDVGHRRVDPLLGTSFSLLDTTGLAAASTSPGEPRRADPTASWSPPSSGSSIAPATTAAPPTTVPTPSGSPSTTTPRATVHTGSNEETMEAHADPTRAMPPMNVPRATAVPSTAMAAAAA